MKVEYRIKTVTRYVLTQYTETEYTGSIIELGEFPNEESAQRVQAAFMKSIRKNEPSAESKSIDAQLRDALSDEQVNSKNYAVGGVQSHG